MWNAAPRVGSPQYLKQLSGQITSETNAGKKFILAPAAVAEGVGVAVVFGIPAAAATLETSQVIIATHPEVAVDIVRGAAAGMSQLPPMSSAGVISWAVTNIAKSFIP